MNASSSSRVGTRPLAIGSGTRRGFYGLGFGRSLGLFLGCCLLLGGGLLRGLVSGLVAARIVGGDGRGLLRSHDLWLLATFCRALGQQRDGLVDRQLFGF